MHAAPTPNDRPATGRRLRAWATLALLILAPPLVLELIDERAGDPGDFVFAAMLLAGAGLACEAAARTPHRLAYPAGWALAVAAALLLAWINLAVGILGSEDNPANLIYLGVIVVAVVGAALARLRPKGLSWAMAATAAAQLAAFIAALAAGFGFTGPITIFFAALWLSAGHLLGRASRVRDMKNQPLIRPALLPGGTLV